MSAGNFRGKNQATLATEAAIIEIVAERAPITVRGVCYALFTRGLISAMTPKEIRRVGAIATAMRESGALDWKLIVDDSRKVTEAGRWCDPSQLINAAVEGYRRDYWQDQPTLVEVWSEKSTVHGVLAPVLDDFGVAFRVMKGFGSFTAVRQAAEDSLDLREGQMGVVLYIGDFDPSGLYMSEIDLPTRLERYGSKWQFQRIAVLPEDTLHLPSFDVGTKVLDTRQKWFVENYGRKCWELDAIDPNALRQRVREQICSRLDLPLWEHAKQIEAVEVASMQGFHQAWKNRLGAKS